VKQQVSQLHKMRHPNIVEVTGVFERKDRGETRMYASASIVYMPEIMSVPLDILTDIIALEQVHPDAALCWR
jgi:hypothetical protein